MGTVHEIVEAYQKLTPRQQQEVILQIAPARVCDFGFEHVLNQETIDAINDPETEEVSLDELRAMCR